MDGPLTIPFKRVPTPAVVTGPTKSPLLGEMETREAGPGQSGLNREGQSDTCNDNRDFEYCRGPTHDQPSADVLHPWFDYDVSSEAQGCHPGTGAAPITK
jgi:hypothetical protein